VVTVGCDSNGLSRPSWVLGRKRHAMVDTDGRPLVLQVHPASVQDRDGAIPLLKSSRCRFPFVERANQTVGYASSSSSSIFAALRSGVAKPSVNQP
jgi:hypothetical protein